MMQPSDRSWSREALQPVEENMTGYEIDIEGGDRAGEDGRIYMFVEARYFLATCFFLLQGVNFCSRTGRMNPNDYPVQYFTVSLKRKLCCCIAYRIHVLWCVSSIIPTCRLVLNYTYFFSRKVSFSYFCYLKWKLSLLAPGDTTLSFSPVYFSPGGEAREVVSPPGALVRENS